MAIEEFRGEHYFLSSMYPLKNPLVLPDGREVSCVEIGYLPERFVNQEDRDEVYDKATNGFLAKQVTNRLEKKQGRPTRPDWDIGKLTVMRALVDQKFERNLELAALLLATGDEPIIEGNNRNDNFWGESPVGNPDALNWLGRMLEDKRRQLREEQALGLLPPLPGPEAALQSEIERLGPQMQWPTHRSSLISNSHGR